MVKHYQTSFLYAFPQSLQGSKYLKLGHVHFISHIFQFIIYSSVCIFDIKCPLWQIEDIKYIKNVYSLKFHLIPSCHLDIDFCSGVFHSGFLARILYTILIEEAAVLGVCDRASWANCGVSGVLSQTSSCGICGEQSDTVTCSLPHPQFFHFPLSVPFIHLLWMLIIFAIKFIK